MARFGSQYVPRIVDQELDDLLGQLPAILIDGPRGVGKTTTALQRARTVIRLDDPNERSVIEQDPTLVERGPHPVLIDEWQRVPEVWDVVRRSVDDDYTPGRFLLTGSQPQADTATHSGAGRIITLRMRPLILTEHMEQLDGISLVSLTDDGPPPNTSPMSLREYTDSMIQSGLPGAQHLTGTGLRHYLDSYIDRTVERDLSTYGLRVRRPETVRSWLTAYAAATATATSWEKISRAAAAGFDSSPSRDTWIIYRDALTSLGMLDDVPAWLPGRNHLRRLTDGPKHHLADPAFAIRLARTTATDLLEGKAPDTFVARDGPFLGALFETMVIQSVRVTTQPHGARVFHLRTRDSRHEVDAIVELPDGGIIAIEAKLASRVDDKDTRHLRWLRDEIGAEFRAGVVVHTGPRAYTRRDGIHVIPLALLAP